MYFMFRSFFISNYLDTVEVFYFISLDEMDRISDLLTSQYDFNTAC